ncbi:LysM peptidoglycan-binding domain-containing protein [Streptomyces sp. NPDC001634]|uniref:transglycosylase SLT domain-containing protein n=1 Tax=Streptomyces sp. NPDC001634 TaxID=3154390 RepID=UPI003320F4A4
MPISAFKRSAQARLFSVGGTAVVGALALSCTGVLGGTAQAADATSATKAAAGTVAKSAGATTYTVQAGDTLAKIARNLKVPGGWQAIASLNKLANPHLIVPGQVLALPKGSSTSGTTKASTVTATTKASTTTSTIYTNNLDGWIKHSLAIMAQNKIPGSYNGIYRNVMRESSGNPKAINNWDSNAAKGTPSKGLLQVIQPTFNAYHVAGTSWDIYDPVANITAACNYAYHRYGSIDNVNGPY